MSLSLKPGIKESSANTRLNELVLTCATSKNELKKASNIISDVTTRPRKLGLYQSITITDKKLNQNLVDNTTALADIKSYVTILPKK